MKFSIGASILGVVCIILGLLMCRFYKQVADNFGSGVSVYNRYKMIGLGLCVAGLILLFNLHNYILEFIAQLITGNRSVGR